MLSPVNIYSGGGLRPCMDSDGAITDSVVLAAARLLTKGTILGQVVGSGTAVAEVQSLIVTGATAGTFRLVYDGEVTAALDYNANAAAVQAALEALPSVGTGGVTCGGGALPGTAVSITFAGGLAGQAQPLITAISSITGGTPVITRTTAGKPAGGYWDAYDDAAAGDFAGLAVARRVLQYDCRMDSQGRIFFGTEKGAADNGYFGRSASAYLAGTFKTSELTGIDAAAVADLGRLISGTTSTLSAAGTILRIG